MIHRLPFRKLTVAGVDYSVRLVRSLRDDDGNECWGIADFERCEIVLVDGPLWRAVKTLCHEIAHLWQEALGLEIEERQAEQLELMIYDLFQGQPAVVSFLQRRRW